MNQPSIGTPRQPSDAASAAGADVLVVGAASRDMDAADGRGWRLGGTVCYASLALARLGLQVRALIGVDAEASQAEEVEWLRAAGAEVELVRLGRAPVLANIETQRGRAQECLSPSDRLPLSALPPAWLSPAALVLGPIAGELGPEWSAVAARTNLVALAWQGLFRRMAAGHQVAALPLSRRRLLARADIAVVSGDDAAAGGAPLRTLLRPGQQLVVTGGARGAIHLVRTASGIRARVLPAVPATHLVDATGAGDVFLAAWCAGLVRGRTAARSLALATAAASLTVEGAGLAGVPARDQLRVRLRGG